MGEVTIRDVEEGVLRALAARAAASGLPVDEVARDALVRGLMLDPQERLAVSRRIRALQPVPLDVDTTAIIRELRGTP